jgi:outer membrane lipoprotein SlyB
VTSKAGYWIGGGLMVLAVLGAIAWGVLGFKHIVSTVDDFQRVAIPGRQTIHLDARKYVIYVEGPHADTSVPGVRILISDTRTSRPLTPSAYGGSLTYSFDTSGSAQATVTPPRAGDYSVVTGGVEAGRGYSVALGESIAGKLVATILGAVAVGAVLGISGLVLVIVTSVRRSRRRKPPVPAAWPPPQPLA